MRPHPLLRLTMRSTPLSTLFMLCIAGLLVGCEDGASGPKVAFAELFEPDEAIVEDGAGETRLRMLEVAFAASTDELIPASLASLDKFGEVFEKMPGARITIEGHTASPGNEVTNLQLSQAQADAVRDYLVQALGAPPVVFTTIGYGEERPIANNATLAGRALNQRIEFIVEDAPRGPAFHVSLTVDRLDVVIDCDDKTGSASAQAGDFVMQTEFYSDDDRGLVLADRSPSPTIRLNDGESQDLDIAAEGLFVASEGAILAGYVDWYENDTGDIEQFELTEALNFRYIASEKCWNDVDAGIIVVGGSGGSGDQSAYCTAPREGEIAAGTLSINQTASGSRDACVADLDWSLYVERIDR